MKCNIPSFTRATWPVVLCIAFFALGLLTSTFPIKTFAVELEPAEEEAQGFDPGIEQAEAESVPTGFEEYPFPAEEEEEAFRGTLVFVIDDAGYNIIDLEPFLAFPGALTVAVLPGRLFSQEAAERIRAAGKELFLHQPMEALARTAEPGAIMIGMEREDIEAIINRNLDELWPVRGLNNHEGSRVTMDEGIMKIILDICRERGILFLDSRTVSATAAQRVADRMGITIASRDIFIDNIQTRENMLEYISIGLLQAEQRGHAVMIGHIQSPALAPLLIELYPELIQQGYRFSTVSELLEELSIPQDPEPDELPPDSPIEDDLFPQEVMEQ